MADSESNTKFPPSNSMLDRLVGVSNPDSVGLYGGDVSNGGQHNTLSLTSLDSFVTAIFSPSSKAAVVALLMVIEVELLELIVVLDAN